MIVRPVCDAETLLIELVIVPDPSLEVVGASATRWATHCALAETVAVLLPVAPGVAWTPSAPVMRARLAGMLPDKAVYSWVRLWLASCVSVTLPCAP